MSDMDELDKNLDKVDRTLKLCCWIMGVAMVPVLVALIGEIVLIARKWSQ